MEELTRRVALETEDLKQNPSHPAWSDGTSELDTQGRWSDPSSPRLLDDPLSEQHERDGRGRDGQRKEGDRTHITTAPRVIILRRPRRSPKKKAKTWSPE